MPNVDLDRRSFLRASGASLAVSLAGCSEQRNPPTSPKPDGSSSTPKPVATFLPTETETESVETVDVAEIVDETTDTPTEEPVQDTTDDVVHLNGISGGTYPPDIAGSHSRRFEWDAVGYEWWIEHNFPKSLGRYYEMRFGRSANFDMYVSDPFGNEYIRSIVDQFRQLKNDNDLSEWEMIDLAMAFVQQLQYTSDRIATGYNQYSQFPVETLIERGGDCEDTSILLAAILREMGYGCVLLLYREDEHMALGVKGDESIEGSYYDYEGSRYYYVETTGDGNRVGEIPSIVQNTSAQILPIKRYPVLVFKWETSIVEDGTVAIDISLYNPSDVPAYNVEFTAFFEDQLERVQAAQDAHIDRISPEQSAGDRLLLASPGNRTLRLTTALRIDDDIHDYDESEWQDPI